MSELKIDNLALRLLDILEQGKLHQAQLPVELSGKRCCRHIIFASEISHLEYRLKNVQDSHRYHQSRESLWVVAQTGFSTPAQEETGPTEFNMSKIINSKALMHTFNILLKM